MSPVVTTIPSPKAVVTVANPATPKAVPVHRKRIRKQEPTPSETITEAILPGFVALPYATSNLPLTNPFIVNVQVTGADLQAVGLQVSPSDWNTSIPAQVLTGSDGLPRAIRLLRE